MTNELTIPHVAAVLPRGLSLIEMLVVVALASTLASVGIPMLRDVMRSYELASTASTLLSHMHLARTEAIRRSSRVVLCKSGDGATCASGGGWEQGWIVFRDANANARREPGESIVQYGPPVAPGLRILGNGTVGNYISIQETGETRLAAGGFQAGTLSLCHVSALKTQARQIVISSVGRARMAKTTVAQCA
jgi:type IV fimbrial biogenesis protein FimT